MSYQTCNIHFWGKIGKKEEKKVRNQEEAAVFCKLRSAKLQFFALLELFFKLLGDFLGNIATFKIF
jgi:hypothetical protein